MDVPPVSASSTTPLNHGTLFVLNRSRRSVIELASVLSLKNSGATQLLLLIGTATETVTALVSGVITAGATLIVAPRTEIELRTFCAAARQSSAVAPGAL